MNLWKLSKTITSCSLACLLLSIVRFLSKSSMLTMLMWVASITTMSNSKYTLPMYGVCLDKGSTPQSNTQSQSILRGTKVFLSSLVHLKLLASLAKLVKIILWQLSRQINTTRRQMKTDSRRSSISNSNTYKPWASLKTTRSHSHLLHQCNQWDQLLHQSIMQRRYNSKNSRPFL